MLKLEWGEENLFRAVEPEQVGEGLWSLARAEANLVWIKFLSKRAIEPVRNLASVVRLLKGKGSLTGAAPSLEAMRLIADLTGPYAVAESFERRLRALGLSPGEDGRIPYTALGDFLSPDAAAALVLRDWTVEEVRGFCENLGALPCAWEWSSESKGAWNLIEKKTAHKQDFWSAMEAMDCLESHRNLFFCLGFQPR